MTRRFCRATLYGVSRVPSDTHERLDEVEPRQLRHCFMKLFQLLQRGKELEGYAYGHYVLSIDGTGYFSSDKVHCQNCCEKHCRDGTTTYYHVGASAPGRRFFPFGEGTMQKKNDCEAAVRLLEDGRREHPHLKLVRDGLAGPHLLKELDLRLGAKPGDHKFLVGQQRTVRGTPRVHGRERYTAPVRSPSERYAFRPRSELSRRLNLHYVWVLGHQLTAITQKSLLRC